MSLPRPAQDVILVHIPKTGGTSLRKALASLDCWDHKLFDYGPTEAQTSQLVWRCLYSDAPVSLRSRIALGKRLFLAGHFPAAKYIDEFPNALFITFVRHPVMQVLSHYKHHVTYLGYRGTIRSFSRAAQFQNVQSRYLESFDIARMSFVGLLEFYALDLIRLSQIVGVAIPYLHKNKLEPLGNLEVGADDLALIESCNQRDMALYASVLEQRFGSRDTQERLGERAHGHP